MPPTRPAPPDTTPSSVTITSGLVPSWPGRTVPDATTSSTAEPATSRTATSDRSPMTPDRRREVTQGDPPPARTALPTPPPTTGVAAVRRVTAGVDAGGMDELAATQRRRYDPAGGPASVATVKRTPPGGRPPANEAMATGRGAAGGGVQRGGDHGSRGGSYKDKQGSWTAAGVGVGG